MVAKVCELKADAYFRAMVLSKKEIIEELNRKNKDFLAWYTDRPVEAMQAAPNGAWTAGQHLLHMMKSTKPLAVGAGYPRILLRWKFGKTARVSASYEEVVDRYKGKLAEGGQATGEFVPRKVESKERDVLVKRQKNEMSVLVNNLHKWSEKNLDNTAVPHPLIGKITLREMLYFTIYHLEHHLKTLEERYT